MSAMDTVAAPQPLDTPVEVAGIRLEYVQLGDALQQIGMTQAELEAVMAPNERWLHPGHMDGWKLSHNAIRFDMVNLGKAISKTKEQVDSGKPLEQWQVKAYQGIAKDFHHNIHQHHLHEEDIFFPYVQKKGVQLPPKMSADHKTLMALLDKVTDVCATQLAKATDITQQQALLADLQTTFTLMRALMMQHLEEEEIIGLPIVRKNLTGKEIMNGPEKEIVSDLKPSDMAWFLRPMATEEKARVMTMLKIPGIIQKIVMMPAVRKDDRTIVRDLRDLANGAQSEQPKRKGFLCFAA